MVVDLMFLFKDGWSLYINSFSFNSSENYMYSPSKVLKSWKDMECLPTNLLLGITLNGAAAVYLPQTYSELSRTSKVELFV